MWSDNQLKLLINERRENNNEYHDLNNRMKYNFWKAAASKINIEFGTSYSRSQCKNKFQSLVKAHKVYKNYLHPIILLY